MSSIFSYFPAICMNSLRFASAHLASQTLRGTCQRAPGNIGRQGDIARRQAPQPRAWSRQDGLLLLNPYSHLWLDEPTQPRAQRYLFDEFFCHAISCPMSISLAGFSLCDVYRKHLHRIERNGHEETPSSFASYPKTMKKTHINRLSSILRYRRAGEQESQCTFQYEDNIQWCTLIASDSFQYCLNKGRLHVLLTSIKRTGARTCTWDCVHEMLKNQYTTTAHYGNIACSIHGLGIGASTCTKFWRLLHHKTRSQRSKHDR